MTVINGFTKSLPDSTVSNSGDAHHDRRGALQLHNADGARVDLAVRRRARANGRVTISDIARQAGVSKTAVSFAFNMPGRLSKETTAKVLEIARQMGYAPNPIARSLNTRRTNAIGLIVPQDIAEVMANPFFAELMRGIGDVCKEAGYSLMLIPPMRGSLLDATYAALVDGCIVSGLDADDPVVLSLVQRRVPFVMLDTDAPPHIASVNVDDCSGAEAAMRHVLDKGHREIAILALRSPTGSVNDYTGTLRRRLDGFDAALQAYGLTLTSPGVRVIECDATVDGGRNGFDLAMTADRRPSAMLCLSDAIAWGVLEAARERGLRLPDDLAVTGFDDLPPSKLMFPALTTVHQPTREKGRRAAEVFLEVLRTDGEAEPERVVLPVELRIRDSA
jgi:DNA-binding LacI/PurR family transcriptional regulator